MVVVAGEGLEVAVTGGLSTIAVAMSGGGEAGGGSTDSAVIFLGSCRSVGDDAGAVEGVLVFMVMVAGRDCGDPASTAAQLPRSTGCEHYKRPIK